MLQCFAMLALGFIMGWMLYDIINYRSVRRLEFLIAAMEKGVKLNEKA